jgi:DNA adenine methylase
LKFNTYLNTISHEKSNYMLDEVMRSQSNSILHSELPVCYPFVKWAGGKTQLLAKLDLFIPPQFSRYFEPFLGGGALFFYLMTYKNKPLIASYVSDINSELINSYLVIRDNVEKLIVLLEQHQIRYKRDPSKYYYQLRKMDLKKVNSTARAARFIALNRTCYNGLYRVNRQGVFNVPWGKYIDPIICDNTNLRNVSLALNNSNAIIQVGNYKEILLENAREGDFIYLDLPYNPTSSTSYFTKYTHTGFNNKDQEELATVFRKLDDRKCKVLLSNSDTQFIKELYSSFAKYIVEVDTLRAINCKGSKRAGHKELIIRNYSNR